MKKEEIIDTIKQFACSLVEKELVDKYGKLPEQLIILVLTRPHSTIIDIGLLFLLYVESQFHNQFQCLYGCLPVVFSF